MILTGKQAQLEFLIGLIETDPEHQLVQAMRKAMKARMLMPLLAGYLERMQLHEYHIRKYGIDHDCVEEQCFDQAGEITALFNQYQALKS